MIYYYFNKEFLEQLKIKIVFFQWQDEFCLMISIEIESLEEQIIQLKEIDSYKDKLLATVAHDLRNPLNSMIYLIDQAISSEKQQFEQEELEILNGNSKILMQLINDILDYCQYKNQKLRLFIETFYLADLIKEIFQTMQIVAKLKNLVLKVQNTLPDDFKIKSDRRRITQILMNLISNALKFTKLGRIKLKIKQKSQLIFFKVEDTGSGMTQDIINNLGAEYNTFGQATNDNKEGIGLGLYISKQLISELGPYKSFIIKSKIGQGSKFIFPLYANYSLKQLQQVESEFCEQNSLSEDKLNEPINNIILNYHTSKLKNISYKQSNLFQKENKLSLDAKIMIVDDNPFNLFVLNKQLNKFNKHFQIFEANDGQQAVEIYQSQQCHLQKIDLIIMDCQMPILNGFEATKIIKQLAIENNQIVKIIGYTANCTDEEINKCKLYGMDNWLQKPASEQQLFSEIENALAQIQN